MNNKILNFSDFQNMNEAEKEKKEEGKDKEKESVELPKEEPVDASKGQYKEMNINGKDYMAVLSTLTAIGSKQEAMGQKKVGIISIPGEEEVYELVPKGEEDKEDKGESDKESNESETVNEEYIEVLNLPELANAMGKIADLWKQWKNGPMTEPSDIKPAQKELKAWLDRWFKDNIK